MLVVDCTFLKSKKGKGPNMTTLEEVYVICPHCGGKTYCQLLCCAKISNRNICSVCKGTGQAKIVEDPTSFWTFQFFCLGRNPIEQAKSIIVEIRDIIPKDCKREFSFSTREYGEKQELETLVALSISGRFSVILAIRAYLNKVRCIDLL